MNSPFWYRPVLVAVSLASLMACSGSRQQETSSPSAPVGATAVGNRQLNLTVLLDLSNRINATYGQDKQQSRDTAIVGATAKIFQADIAKRGGFLAKGAYQIYFEPQPQLAPDLNQVASSLQFDLSKSGVKPADKKVVYNTVVKKTTTGVQSLYDYVRKQPFIGSDIWSFAKDKMASRCIKDPAKYRNVLVLVTDGYIDHVRSRGLGKGHKVSSINDVYISKSLIRDNGFTQTNWLTKYESGGFGLYPPPSVSLKGLEVLVLEVNVYNRPPLYADLVRRYVKDWFLAMGADKAETYETDLPVETAQEIQRFMQ